jgi:hypothetical protein
MTDASVLGIIRHEHLHRQEGERRDSLEIGTAKTGVIKVYGNADDPEAFEKRIRTMISLRERALAMANGGSP